MAELIQFKISCICTGYFTVRIYLTWYCDVHWGGWESRANPHELLAKWHIKQDGADQWLLGYAMGKFISVEHLCRITEL